MGDDKAREVAETVTGESGGTDEVGSAEVIDELERTGSMDEVGKAGAMDKVGRAEVIDELEKTGSMSEVGKAGAVDEVEVVDGGLVAVEAREGRD